MNRGLLWIAIALAVIVGLPSVFGEFVLDDPVAVVDSTCVTRRFHFGRIWASNFWCETGEYLSIESWRPLTVALWWVVYHLSPTRAAFAVLCLVLHATNTWLVYGLARDFEIDKRAAGWAAIVFAALAIHIDAIATAVGSAELLSALLVLACLRGFIRGKWWCVPLGALAVLAKESGVLAFALVATMAVLHPGGSRFDRQSRFIVAGALGALTFLVLAMRADVLGGWTAQHVPAFVNPLVDASAVDRVTTGVALVGRYHRLALLGSPLGADYAANALGVGRGSSVLDLSLGALVVAGLAAGTLRLRRRPALLFLLAWWAGACLFISNVIFIFPAMFAERLFYVASVALVLTAATLAPRIKIRPQLARAVLVAFVGAQVALAVFHAQRYTDERSIVEATVQTVPDNARARKWLAVILLEDGQLSAGRDEARAASELRPDWGAPVALEAAAEDLLGDPDAALKKFRHAMRLDPHDAEVADPFIQFLLRYGHKKHARLVYDAHVQARGKADPRVTVPAKRQ